MYVLRRMSETYRSCLTDIYTLNWQDTMNLACILKLIILIILYPDLFIGISLTKNKSRLKHVFFSVIGSLNTSKNQPEMLTQKTCKRFGVNKIAAADGFGVILYKS